MSLLALGGGKPQPKPKHLFDFNTEFLMKSIYQSFSRPEHFYKIFKERNHFSHLILACSSYEITMELGFPMFLTLFVFRVSLSALARNTKFKENVEKQTF